MIRALLSGTKTQTRRVIKPQPELVTVKSWPEPVWRWRDGSCGSSDLKHFMRMLAHEKYQVSSRLWVRETWAPFDDRELDPPEFVWYRADMSARNIDGELLDTYAMPEPKWKPSIFMPRCLSRITLEITDIRVQRLCEITEKDAIAEGVNCSCGPVSQCGHCAKHEFIKLWDSINGKRPGCTWEDSPWVWAISFKQVQP